VLIARTLPGAPRAIADLAARGVAIPENLPGALRDMLVDSLNEQAPGWVEVAAENDKAAVRLLVENPMEVAAAASSFVQSGPFDLVGDGRKELEYDRPGTLDTTAILHTSEDTVSERASVYYGCVYSRTDSGARRLTDFNGRTFAFSDETSVSGHICPRMLLDKSDVSLGRVYYAGGHPNVIQAVWDGKAIGGSAFYSPPSAQQLAEGLYVGDARYLLLKRMDTDERRRRFLEDVRVLKLTDPIPNDLCAVRKGFPEKTWQRFLKSFDRFLETPQGQEAFADILAGVAVTRTDDSVLTGFRAALDAAGMSADTLLQSEEEKLEKKRQAEESSP
jgi:ABC-type phosphate/phosphonate transport system substrate-binding protein